MLLSKIFNLPNITLVTALTLSAIAAWYSIVGLTAIFAAAVIPIIIMGGALEFAKVITTVWLHRYWHHVQLSLKIYLSIAVVALAFLTSMGIFGFLSKAHTDQSLVSGDVQAQIAIYDEKIKIAKENIDANRRALKQMDEAVDQVMGRSTTEQGAERSVQIRRQQGPERRRLINEIEAEQKKITELNEARAPIAAEVRKVEAEVGPIKYIAAMIYGDDPDTNLLEKAVRWVIILIVFVFDPLALTLVIAATSSRKWNLNVEETHAVTNDNDHPADSINQGNVDGIDRPEPILEQVLPVDDKDAKPLQLQIESCEQCGSEMIDVPNIGFICSNIECGKEDLTEEKDEINISTHPYLFTKFAHFGNLAPVVYIPEKKLDIVYSTEKEIDIEEVNKELQLLETTNIEPEFETEVETTKSVEKKEDVIQQDVEIVTVGVTEEIKPKVNVDGDYATFEGKHFHINALKSMHPELFLTADSSAPAKSDFGTQFPKASMRGDIFVRVDMLPNRVYKFDGKKWIEINKEQTDTYLYDQKYIKFLIDKLEKGEYDVELLSDLEKNQIEEYLKNQNL